MINLANYLKEKRQASGLSIDDIANKTKISINNLQNLENFDEEKLPSSVFIRGYIRLYCKALGIDSSEAIKIYESYLIRKQEEIKNKIKARRQVKQANKIKFSFKSINLKSIKNINFKSKWFIGSVILTIVVLGLFFLLKDSKESKSNNVVIKLKTNKNNKVELKEKEFEKEKTKEKNTNEKEAKSIKKEEKIQKIEQEKKQKQKQKKEEVFKKLPKKLLKDKNKEEKEIKKLKEKEKVIIKEAKKEEDKEEDKEESKVLDSKILSIKAVRKVWIKTKLDEKDSFHFTLESGEEKILKANEKIRLYIGDPSAVELKYNNDEVIQGFGHRGVPRTIVFPDRTKWYNALSM
jgi:cytoskeletal protein RodZ